MRRARGKKLDLLEMEQRRKSAAKLLERGLRQAEVARRVGVSRESVRRWANRIAVDGVEGLKTPGRTGRKAELSAGDLQQLALTLQQGPEKAGYPNGLWTLERVAAVIERSFGIRYHPGHVWKILRLKLRWSCQRPVGRARERKEAEIKRWKRECWPEIKKKPKRRGAPSSL
jgi:transposase